MTAAKRKQPRRRSDPFAIPVLFALLACLGLIGRDLYQGMSFRRELINRMNAAVERSNAGSPRQALDELLQVEQEWTSRRNTPAEAWLQKIQPFSMQMGERLAVVHKNLGLLYADAQLSDLASRHYGLALVNDPACPGTAQNLATECFRAKNYELGWVAAQMAQAEDPNDRILPTLIRHFEKHYTGPKHDVP